MRLLRGETGHHAYRRLHPAGCAAATGALPIPVSTSRWPPRSPRPVLRGARFTARRRDVVHRGHRPTGTWTCWPSTGRRGKRSPPSTVTSRTGQVAPRRPGCTWPRPASRRSWTSNTESSSSRYFSHLLPGGPVQGDTVEEILANNNQSGFAVIGTPADAIARSRSSSRRATAGSARSCCWTTTGPGRRPRCTATNCSPSTSCRTSPGQLAGPAASCDWVRGAGPCSWSAPRARHRKAIEDHGGGAGRTGSDLGTVGTIIGWRR